MSFDYIKWATSFASSKSSMSDRVAEFRKANPKVESKDTLDSEMKSSMDIGFLNEFKKRRAKELNGAYVVYGEEAKPVDLDTYTKHTGAKIKQYTIDEAMNYSQSEVTNMKDTTEKAVVMYIRKKVQTDRSDNWTYFWKELSKQIGKPSPKATPPAVLPQWFKDLVKKAKARIKTAEARGDTLEPSQLKAVNDGLEMIRKAFIK